MRFLFVAPRYHTNQHFIMKALIDRGHELKFVSLYRTAIEEYGILEPTLIGFSMIFRFINRICNRRNRYQFMANYGFPRLTRFYGIIRDFDPDILIVRGPKSIVFWLTVFFAKSLQKKLIVYSQGPKYRSYVSKKNRAVRWFLLDVLKCAWITPVKGDKENSRISHRCLYYLPFIYEVKNACLKRTYFENDKVRVMTVGKFLPRKKHILLLEAIKEVGELNAIQLTLIGENSSNEHKRELEKVKHYIDLHNMSDRVEIKNNLKFSSVQNEYDKHDIFVLPSCQEPAAYSILEAMAHGLAVVCSDSNGTKCYVKNGRTGYIFKSNCVSDLTNKLLLLVADRKKIMDFGRNGVALVKKKHCAENYHDRLMEIVGGRT